MAHIDGLLSIFCLLTLVVNATNVQDDWIFPYNAAVLESPASMKTGDTVRIQWTDNLWSWLSICAPYSSVNDVDLWITDYELHQYQHLVGTAINVNATYSLSWKVQLPAEEIDDALTWVFRFMQAGFAPNQTTYQISSPLVVVRSAAAQSSSSDASASTKATTIPASSTTASTFVPATSTASSNTVTVTPTAQNNPVGSHSGLGTGLIAGIAVGGVLAVVLLIAVGWWLARRTLARKDVMAASNTSSAPMGEQQSKNHPTVLVSSAPEYSQRIPTYQELESTNHISKRPAELH